MDLRDPITGILYADGPIFIFSPGYKHGRKRKATVVREGSVSPPLPDEANECRIFRSDALRSFAVEGKRHRHLALRARNFLTPDQSAAMASGLFLASAALVSWDGFLELA